MALLLVEKSLDSPNTNLVYEFLLIAVKDVDVLEWLKENKVILLDQ
jgi:hypothetical protein